MQRKTDILAKYPRATPAANEEFTAVASGSDKVLARPRTMGWDPYEVWRTRVKATQDSAQGEITVG